MVRNTLAYFLAGDNRSAPEVLLDALHASDALLQYAKQKVLDGETITVDTIERLEQAIARATAVSKVTMDARVTGALRVKIQGDGELVAEAVIAGINALGLSEDQRMLALAAAYNRMTAHTAQPRPIVGELEAPDSP